MSVFKTQYVVIDSADNKSSTNSHNPVTVDYRQDIQAGVVNLEHFNMPYSIYTINTSNAAFIYDPDDVDSVVFLTDGHYTIAELVTHIQEQIRAVDDVSTNGVTVTYSNLQQRVVVTNPTNAFGINWGNLGPLLGFYHQYDLLNPVTLDSLTDDGNEVLTADMPVDLSLNEIYIHIDEFASNTMSSNGTNFTFCIPVDVNVGEILFHDNRDSYEITAVNQNKCRTLRISLRDAYGRDLTGVGDWTMILSISVAESRN